MSTVYNKDTNNGTIDTHSCASIDNFEQVIPCWDRCYHKQSLWK